MVQFNELRIGNLVHVGNGIYERVVEILCDSITTETKQGIFDFEGIPLTPEILEKAGFECYGVYPDGFSSYIKKGVEIHLPYFEFCYSDSDYKTEIKYIHQLQNLYFALTGEELQIDL